MELTIEQYVKNIYSLRSEVDVDRKKIIESIHAAVSDRVRLKFPLYHIDSYNINSCIVPLDNGANYYHVIDHSMFQYFEMFLSAFEYRQPNLAYLFYQLLRQDICISQNDVERAAQYKNPIMYMTDYDMNREMQRLHDPLDFNAKYELMIRFYFLHEYAHYLAKNPMRQNTSNEFLDMLVEDAFENMEGLDVASITNSIIHKAVLRIARKKQLSKYRSEYHSNPNFREEIDCDFQAIFCLLELAGRFNVATIIESAITMIYMQYYVWMAKRVDNKREWGNIFHFRLNLLAFFAYQLEDKEYSDLMCQILNSGNRYNNLTNLQCSQIDTDKHQRFYLDFARIHLADKKRKKSNSSNPVLNSDDEVGEYIITKRMGRVSIKKVKTNPRKEHRRLEELHRRALEKASENKNGYLDFLSLKAGGLKLTEIEKYNDKMFYYIKSQFPGFFEAHPNHIAHATTTTLFVWEDEGRLFV